MFKMLNVYCNTLGWIPAEDICPFFPVLSNYTVIPIYDGDAYCHEALALHRSRSHTCRYKTDLHI